jgi:hypothetical protein
MYFRASFCSPFKKEIIDLGSVEKDKIIDLFNNTPWLEYLQKMSTAKLTDIHYSPSLEIENIETKQGLCISVIGNQTIEEYYLFYKRPKLIKTFFGFKQKIDNNYCTDKTGQNKQDVLDCLNALINNDTIFLENKIGV